MSNAPFRIIVIDDNPDIHKDFIKILTISNTAVHISELEETLFNETKSHDKLMPEFKIDTASQGEEGVVKIRKALEKGNPYALAFVDIRMPPGMDGIETIKQIWELDPEIQVVICTAYSDYSWEETVNALGITENLLILKKPFDVISVRQLTTALTQKWLVSRHTKNHTSSLNHLVNEHTESLAHSLALLRATLESSMDGILVIDLEGNIIDFNQKLLEKIGINPSFIKQANEQQVFEYLFNKLEDPVNFQRVFSILAKKIDSSSKYILKFKNQHIFECYSKPHRVRSKIVGRVWSFHDLTEQISLKNKLEHQATHDALTGLPNRALLMNQLQHQIARASRNKLQFALFFLDLDRFKYINDTLSHETGDNLLIQVANRLSNSLRKMDIIARLGGDEFILIITEINQTSIIAFANKLLKLFEKPFVIAAHQIKISVSIGISLFPKNGTRADEMLSNSDMAMYQAKAQGGNQFFFYTPELNKRSKHFFKIETELQQALAKEEFFLVYQPQFNIHKKAIHSVEALLRWQHPQRGIILPNDFIPIAESTGLIVQLGEWAIKAICKQFIKWEKQNLGIQQIAVNVATKQLRLPDFPNIVKQMLNNHQLPPRILQIEITENVIIDKEIQQTILKLKRLGFSIVLDDFGSGNSSLNTLKELKIDELKIDRCFVNNISKSRGDEAIIEAIIAIARSMNFKVVAEGVETQIQLEFLRNRNCDQIQGYLASKPLTADELGNFLKINPL